MPTYENPNREFQEKGSSVYASPMTPISASVLNTPKLANLPQPVDTPLPVAPTLPSIEDILGATSGDTALSKKFEETTIDTANTSAELAGEGGYRATQEQAYDLSGKKATVNDLTNRFNTLKAQADQIPLQIQQEFAGRGATAGGVSPIQTGQLRENTIQQIGISAMLNAANGNLSTAQDQVEYAVKAKFDPIKARLEAQMAQLAAITPLLEREDKKRAVAQQAALTERARLIEKAENDQKTIYQTMLAAAENGADASTLRKIQNASTPQEAISAAGTVLGAKFADAKKQQEFDNNIKLAQLAIDERKATTEGGGGSYDPLQILAYAQQYASTGAIPTGLPKGSFGVVSQVAKELPKPEGTVIDLNTGTKPNISDVKIDGFAALYDITKKVQELKALDTQRAKGLVSGTTAKIFGFDIEQRYADLRTEIVDLLSRARTGAALTESEEAFYAGQLPGRVSTVAFIGPDTQKRIDNFASKIEGTLDTKLKANQAALVGFSKVKIGGNDFTVGQTVTNASGQQGRVNADGSITLIQ